MKLFFDGGWRPATGMEVAVVIGGSVHVERRGPGSAMEAEWLALVHAATLARTLGFVDPVLLGDAAAVIAQARGEVRCPAAFLHHRDAWRASGSWRLRYVKRTQNLAGIALAARHGR